MKTCDQSTSKAWTGNRPRFLRIVLLFAIVPSLLSGCSWYGNNLSTLPASDGWFPLPVQRWLVNAGIETTAMIICPPDRCASPAVAILFKADTATARLLDTSLSDDRALTQRKPRAILRRIGLAPKPVIPKVEAISQIERFNDQGNPVLRIAMLPKTGQDKPAYLGKPAYAVVISIKQSGAHSYALAVATSAELALSQARAIVASSIAAE